MHSARELDAVEPVAVTQKVSRCCLPGEGLHELLALAAADQFKRAQLGHASTDVPTSAKAYQEAVTTLVERSLAQLTLTATSPRSRSAPAEPVSHQSEEAVGLLQPHEMAAVFEHDMAGPGNSAGNSHELGR